MGDPDFKKLRSSYDLIDSEAASDNLHHDDDVPDAHSGSGKIGVAGAVFLILNKMIGTGSKYLQSP
jgi:hypothetical protein